MGKALIIAEKPSVAKDVAAALGGFRVGADGVLERDNAIITSGIGHLVQIGAPEGTDKGWDLVNLPFMPPEFALQPIERTQSQLRLIGKLLKRTDVDSVINCCDAGREGELIFQLIYDFHRSKKPIRRMWLQSMTSASIKEAYSNTRSGAEMQSLADAARSRTEADWLVGINATRAVTKLRERQGKEEGAASAGRVQTPVLTLMYLRELAIKNFVPRDFWEVHGRFGVAGQSYDGKWFDPRHQKTDDDANKSDRTFDLDKAKAIEAKCQGLDPSSVEEESKPKTSMPPKLFDLTTLQRVANTKFGFSAKATLEIAQALYEKHKVLSYPRTDASALPEDYVETAKERLGSFGGTPYAAHAERVLANNWVKQEKRIFDNSKISDHFAIIPTGQKPSGLTTDEAKIYDLVVKRFIAVFYPAAEYRQTTRITVVADELFKSQGSVLVNEGWLQVYGRDASDESGKSLCPLVEGAQVTTESITSVGMKTTPPDRYTEDTLLGAMENVGRLVDDEELKDILKAHGLGTPATRAAIIEELLSIKRDYVKREKKFLVPTDKGMQIIDLLLKNGVESLTSPVMTGEWEHKLRLIEQGKLSRQVFMTEVRELTTYIVTQIRQKAASMPQVASTGGRSASGVPISAPCPKCAGSVAGDAFVYRCGSCDFKMWREVAGRKITEAEASVLITEKITPVLKGFKSKTKKPFDAMLVMGDDCAITFKFANAIPESSNGAPRECVGTCPKCQSNVVVGGEHYFCEKSFGDTKSCDFRLWGTVAGRKMEIDTVKSLLSTGKTSLLTGFKSSKPPHKAFSAFLVLKSDHTTGFEFEKR